MGLQTHQQQKKHARGEGGREAALLEPAAGFCVQKPPWYFVGGV
jgi:hypothetical protein